MESALAAPFMIVGFMTGVIFMLFGFIMVMGSVVNIPGLTGANYSFTGFVVTTFGLFMIGNMPKFDSQVFDFFALACFVAGLMLVWTGEKIFTFKPAGRAMWILAGAAMTVFILLELFGIDVKGRLVYCSAVAGVFWVLMLSDKYLGGKRAWTPRDGFMIAGCVVLAGNAWGRVLVGFGLLPALAIVQTDVVYLLARFIGTMVGAIFISIYHLLTQFARMVAQTDYAATHDELTGLMNRRAINQSGEREVELARRNGQPLAVAFVDIDFFKNINDTYSHDMGDLALKEVAAALSETCRSVDLLGRYGGEEFCLIFPGDGHAGAEIVGERLLRAVRERKIADIPAVTISIGIALFDAVDPSQDWHCLVKLADLELYKAKHGGRNRCSIAPMAAPAVEIPPTFPPLKLVAAH